MKASADCKSIPVYTQISKLPFDVFIELACGVESSEEIDITDYSIVGGIEGWENIQDQYNTAMGQTTSRRMELAKEIESLNIKLSRIANLIELMRICPDENFCKSLEEEGFNNVLNVEGVELQSRRFQVRLEELKADFDRLQKDDDQGKPTPEQFYRNLVSISDFKKRNISASEISTLEYTIHYKELVSYHSRNGSGKH